MLKLFKFIAILSLVLTFPAEAQMSKTAVQSQILLNWPDNNSNVITASKLRIPNQIIVNSYLDLNGATSFQCPANQAMSGFSTLSAPSCNLISDLVTTTGTGAFVLALAPTITSPILVTPNLGTPSAATLTNAIGLPVSTGISGLASGISIALSTAINSAGSIIINGGALGTPLSGTLTNVTGLPISTGISGLGTGISTALATSVGTSGSVVTNGGALGTPSSATLTNATALPVSSGISGLGTGVATALGVAIGSAGSPIINGGVLGTPSAGVGTNLTALNASNLSSGTVAAARGGAGTITGALKGSGAGVVTQAACADLSNASVYCAAVAGQMPGTATNDNATAGNVGEFVTATLASGSAVPLTTNTAANVTSISLTPGDWDVWGTVYFTGNASTQISSLIASVSATTGALDGNPGRINTMPYASATLNAFATNPSANVLPFRVSVAATTTYFLVGQSGFTTSTESAFGIIQARRRR